MFVGFLGEASQGSGLAMVVLVLKMSVIGVFLADFAADLCVIDRFPEE